MARALRLQTVKVQLVHQVSGDDVSFPFSPAELRVEIWRQAMELYTFRAGVPVEYGILLRGAALLGSITPDQLDFFTYNIFSAGVLLCSTLRRGPSCSFF